jgi:transcriptional regulator with XRE-family HTH domain
MAHTTRYAFKGRSRLARDCGVSKSAISRLLNGHTNPSFPIALRVADALSRELDRKLDIRELFSEDGGYGRTFICDLVGCPGCLPAEAINDDGHTDPRYKGLRKGFWTGDVYEMEGPVWQPIEEMG